MPIIDTVEDRQKLVRARLIQLVEQSTNHIKNDRKATLDTIWDNGRGLTPQEVLAGLGEEDAARLTVSDILLRTILNYADPATALSPLPEGYACVLKNVANVEVTVDAEITALLVKLASITKIEITYTPPV